MENKVSPGSCYQPLFDLLNQEHGITPLESEMADIIVVVEKMREAHPGPVWVKCWEQKPDTHKVRFKDKHGNEFIGNYSKDTGQYWAYGLGQAINDVIYWRPQDESAADIQIDREWVNNALVEFALAYNRSNNKDIANDAAEYLNDKLKEAGVIYVLSEDESAAGREDAVEFAEWLIDNHYEITWGHKWVNFKMPGNNRFTSAEVYKLFKQQKEK